MIKNKSMKTTTLHALVALICFASVGHSQTMDMTPQQEEQDTTKTEELNRLRASRTPIAKGFEDIYLFMPLEDFQAQHKSAKVVDENPRDVEMVEELRTHPLFDTATYSFEEGQLVGIVFIGEFNIKEFKDRKQALLNELVFSHGRPSQIGITPDTDTGKVRLPVVFWEKRQLKSQPFLPLITLSREPVSSSQSIALRQITKFGLTLFLLHP